MSAAEQPPELDPADALTLLATGELQIEGRLVDASNATLLAAVSANGITAACVYKPVRGERPLWDFPDGTLAGREVSTYLLDQTLGWDLVPPTLLRDGPFGPGMCQLWIESESVDELVDLMPRERVPKGWFPVFGGVDGGGRDVVVAHADDTRLRRLAVLDSVANNADRKGGHLLLTAKGHLYGVDHGLCFHEEPKLRTLLWGWGGEPLEAEEIEALTRLRAELESGPLREALEDHLTDAEVRATVARVDRMLRTGRFPRPAGSRHTVPWPPF
ncbi:SCO1664 family protein [Cryptosporangium minutisporangium]|uniref:SCO1664 family protein n=1 Tax=Cryptosporangium minutisporangium TaxID=113569 RepID=UPI0031ED8341